MLSRFDTDIQTCLRKLQTVAGTREATGAERPEIVRIGSKAYAAFVTDIPADQQLMSGGEMEMAKFTVLISKAELPTAPKPGACCEVRGVKYDILNPVVDKRSFWEISVGDYSR